jgi:hypothetical protein
MNYPNAVKSARGRVIVRVGPVACDLTAVWAAEDLEAVFPQTAQPQVAPPQSGGVNCAPSEASLSDELLDDIRNGGVSRGLGASGDKSRSGLFHSVIGELKKLKWTVDQINALLERYPQGVAAKYSGRLREEIERSYKKVGRKSPRLPLGVASGGAGGRSSPPPPPPPPPGASSFGPTSGGTPLQALGGARAAFRKWLGAKYDTDILDIVASAGAAERLGGDPLWLMVISGSGNAKTETTQSLSGAGAIITSTIASEGALLSATPRSRGSTGGLLHKIGSRGLLVLKDLTTIMAMDGKARGVVLAALREIHDGRWERNVGYSGGRTLTWTGRIVVVAACTTVWDEARKTVEALGDRFVLVRSDSRAGRREAAAQAIENTGNEVVMRAELAQAMGALVASADLGVRELNDAERARLIKLADTVTWARSGVERDYRGGIVNDHAPEMPTRFAKQLAQVMRGALSIGVSTDEAMRLAVRCAGDSLEPLRRILLLDVAQHPGSNPDDVHRRTGKPLTTVKNTLIAMHTLRLLICEEREERHGNREFTVPYYWLARDVDEAVLLSM